MHHLRYANASHSYFSILGEKSQPFSSSLKQQILLVNVRGTIYQAVNLIFCVLTLQEQYLTRNAWSTDKPIRYGSISESLLNDTSPFYRRISSD
jgi:hypothetical protein